MENHFIKYFSIKTLYQNYLILRKKSDSNIYVILDVKDTATSLQVVYIPIFIVFFNSETFKKKTFYEELFEL